MKAELQLSQKEANYLLRAIECFININSEICTEEKEDIDKIYDKILDEGIRVGFGQNKPLK